MKFLLRALVLLALCRPGLSAWVVNNDTAVGRVRAENDLMIIEWGYLPNSGGNGHEGGGTPYVVRWKPTGTDLVARYLGGTLGTGCFGAGAAGWGCASIYGVDDPSQIVLGDYGVSMSDNNGDSTMVSPPVITVHPEGTLEITFLTDVANPRTTGSGVTWFRTQKRWRVSPAGRMRLDYELRILRTAYYSEPAIRMAFTAAFDYVTRDGHNWSEPPSERPRANSRVNPANMDYTWYIIRGSEGHCGETATPHADGIHCDFLRFGGTLPISPVVRWDGTSYRGLGYEGTTSYFEGYNRMGGSEGSTVLEACYHDRRPIGDGTEAISLALTSWWGGNGATPGRFALLQAGTVFNDTVEVEIAAAGSDWPGAANILTGAGHGPSNANRARVFNTGGAIDDTDFTAYGAGSFGTNVGAGALDSAVYDEILTGPGPGAVYGPQVRGWDRTGTAMGKINFYAYGTLKYGVNVDGADVDPDAFSEILTGAGPGEVFGPHVRAFNYDGAGVVPMAGISFFAYGTPRFGVNVASGELDADGFHEILTGPGPGAIFGAQVRAFEFDGGPLWPNPRVNFNAYTLVYGARVAGGNADGDAFDEILTAPGAGTGNPAQFKGFNVDGGSVTSLPGFVVTPFATSYGGSVAGVELSADARDELVVGAGRDPIADSTVKTFGYGGSSLVPTAVVFVAFPGTAYGVNVSDAALAF